MGRRSRVVRREGETAPWRTLNSKVHDAIEWILQTAQRLIDRRSQRVDRSVEYRHLARLFNASTDTECHAIYDAAFRLGAPRHFFVVESDPDLIEATRSWHHAPPAPVETYLSRPGGRAGGGGTPPALPDYSAARARHRARQARETARPKRRSPGSPDGNSASPTSASLTPARSATSSPGSGSRSARPAPPTASAARPPPTGS